MAVEIPVVIDIEGAFADAAKRVKTAATPLRRSIEQLNDELATDMQLLRMSEVNDVVFKEAAKDIQRITQEMETVNDQFKKFSSNPGSIRRMNNELASLSRRWEQMGQNQKFTADGKFSADAEKLIADYIKLTQKIQDTGQALAKVAAERQRLAEERTILASTATTMDVLNEKLKIYQQRLSSAAVGSVQWENAANGITLVAYNIEKAAHQLRIFQTETGSINRITAELQHLNKVWNDMGSAEKFVGSGSKVLSTEAQKLVTDYAKWTKELQTAGKSLSEIAKKQELVNRAVENASNKRKYESAILKSSVTTMRVLQEQERILSDRLSRTQVGTTKYTKLQADLDKVRVKMQEIKGTTAGVNTELKRQSTIWSSIASYASMYFSFFGAVRFIKNVRETTAEFELQRVALAGIIQDTNKAEALFKEIKAAAIESPFQIKQLVTYTKQLSAYRVETDKLFDVTNRLADVSAGLGVDMNRLVLAYGQVKSASVLRGQELRQFTEAGIPLVDLLAKKFQELGREGTTTADVFELISKRAVPFSMIAEIFDDMTNKGGIFYKMQEKQAETLAGQWSNLKDALSIMYDEIGNTASVHGAMEKLISDAKFLFNNWRIVGGVLKGVAQSFIAIKLVSLFIPTLTKNTALAAKATAAKAKADELEAMNASKANFARTVAIRQLRAYTAQMNKAATATTIIGRSWHQMAANLAGGGWISLATTAVMLLVSWLISARQESERLGKELAGNIAKGNIQADQSVRNFERLANMAVSAADGSVEQREALKELQRTYGDILPVEDLQISKLQELKGNYKQLTDVIREKIDLQIHEQNISQISDSFAASLANQRKGLEKFLKDQEDYSVDEAARIMSAVEDAIKSGLLTIETDFKDAANIIEDIARRQVPNREPLPGFGQAFQQASGLFSFSSYYKRLLKDATRYDREISDEEARFNALNNQLGIYADKLKEIREELKKDPIVFSLSQLGTFEYSHARMQQGVERIKNELKNALAPVDISDAIGMDDFIDFNKIIKKVTASNGNADLKAFVSELQKDYLKLAPQESSTRLITQRAQEIAHDVGVAMTDIKGYLKEDGQSMKDYTKSLNEFLDTQKKKVEELKWLQQGWTMVSTYERPTDQDIAKEQKEVDFLERLLAGITQFGKEKKGSYQQDPFINKMQERIKFMQDFEKGYKNLTKYISEDAALEKQFSIMQNRGISLGIDPSEQKRAAKELSKWYEDARAMAFEQAKKYGASGTVDEFLRQEINDASNKGKALKDFQKLIQSLWDAQTDLDTSEFERTIKEALERVTENVKRSEAARNFYNNILGLTGDESLATSLSISVYGNVGDEFKDRIKKQLVDSLSSLDAEAFSGLDDAIRAAFDAGDYEYLVKNLDKVPNELRNVIKTIASDAERYNAGVISNYAKLLNKFDELEQKRVNIENQADQDIKTLREGLALELKGINENVGIEDKESARKAAEDRVTAVEEGINRERRLQLSRLTRDYRMFFSSVGVISDQAARKVAKAQKEMITEQFLSGQKTLAQYTRELNEIDKQLDKYTKNKGLFASYLSGGIDEAVSKMDEFSSSLLAIADASKNKKDGSWIVNADDKEYIDKLGMIFGGKLFGVAGRKDVFSKLMEKTGGNADKMAKAITEASDSIKEMGSNMSASIMWADLWVKNIGSAIKLMDELGNSGEETAKWWDEVASRIFTLGIVGSAENNKLGLGIKGAGDRLSYLNEYALSGFEKFKSGDFVGAITDNIKGWYGVFGPNIKRIDKQIKEQSRLIDDLEYSYTRLDAAIEKSFGSEYIYNFNKQLEVLEAKAEAYRKQAELEESKLKAADSDKIREYRNQARDVEDQITELRTQLSEFLAGTDLTSAAEDFANAWIEAYKEFGSTTDAMSEKFNDMINSMINRSLAAKIMQEMLQPVFDQIDTMAKDGLLSTEEISSIAALAQERIPMINDAMTNLMASLAAAGLDVRTSTAGVKGISKSIAGASEESILGLAAAINTQNFYMSFMPQINENVATILATMAGGASVADTADGVAPEDSENGEIMPSVQKMIYDHLPLMDQNLSELLRLFRSVITTKSGSTNTNYVAVK